MDKNSTERALIRNAIVLLIAAFIVWATIPYSQNAGGRPLIGVLATLAFVIHWVAFIPAFLKQTEKFYDLTGT